MDGGRRLGEAPAGALHDVDAPALVVVAAAVVRAGHLAVARVEVAAVAEGEAVGRVGTEEICTLGLEVENFSLRTLLSRL